MIQNLRNRIHATIRRFGWVVQRTSSLEKQKRKHYREIEVQKWAFTSRYEPRTVLDIGANTGQFAELIREVCPEARIISFEPILECYRALKANQKITPPFDVINTALGK